MCNVVSYHNATIIGTDLKTMGSEVVVVEAVKAVATHAPTAFAVARAHPVAAAAVAVTGLCALAWIGTRPGAKVNLWGFSAQGPEKVKS